ncbi:MAG: Dinitrogenase iron-molybdenum cofactor [Candidatus Methanoperedenaceae archaeon GB50]|nr:Dinitrogenase iron-molybdenum cofactor [Candidatus Methanoperedenaceae archaeon GB50]CAD7773931.1 MAG: Dinitrogenase iron-molybdenum cofactor [Candidatus Methanoperedenaceae archaeon GB50]
MKVAVSANAPSLDAQIEPRFGRAPYFVFVDTDTMDAEIIENPFISQMSGVGIQVAQLVAEKGVQAIITGNVGPKAFQGLSAAGIQIITISNGTVREAVEKFKQGKLTPTPSATSPAHTGGGWGRGMGKGMGMGLGMGRGMGGRGYGGVYSPSAETETLKQQLNNIQQTLEQIIKRLDALEKEKK